MGTRSARKRRRLLQNMVRNEVSAGGVVVRQRDGKWEVLLIATHEGERWSLPKGHVESGETAEEAAIREVREETGVQAEIIAPLNTIEYWFRWKSTEGSLLIHKRVHFFLMRYLAGDPRNHGWEVDDARWFDIDEAIEKVTYKDERELLQQARQLLQEKLDLFSQS